MPIVHSNYEGYLLKSGRVQRYGNFLAQGDSGFDPTYDLMGQYDTKVAGLTEGERVTFDVEQDAFGDLYAVNVQPE